MAFPSLFFHVVSFLFLMANRKDLLFSCFLFFNPFFKFWISPFLSFVAPLSLPFSFPFFSPFNFALLKSRLFLMVDSPSARKLAFELDQINRRLTDNESRGNGLGGVARKAPSVTCFPWRRCLMVAWTLARGLLGIGPKYDVGNNLRCEVHVWCSEDYG